MRNLPFMLVLHIHVGLHMVNQVQSILIHNDPMNKINSFVFIMELLPITKISNNIWQEIGQNRFGDDALGEFQTNKGYKFESETDTEVVVKLVKYLYDKHKNEKISFQKLIEMACSQLVNPSRLTITQSILTFSLGRCLCSSLQKYTLSRRIMCDTVCPRN